MGKLFLQKTLFMHQVPPPCPEARTSEGIPTMGKIHSHHGKQNITNITTNITPNYLIIKTSDVCDIFLAKIKNIVRISPPLRCHERFRY